MHYNVPRWKCSWHAEFERSLRHNFHWFELYLGILVAIVLMGTAALLIWEANQKKHQRDRWRTRDNLEANVDGRVLARLLGDVSPAERLVHDLHKLDIWLYWSLVAEES